MIQKFKPLALTTLSLLLAAESSARALELSLSQAAGRAILERHCARCHAIDGAGTSPLALAPPLRDAYTRFSREELKMRLSEGIGSHFSGMPQIAFSSEEVAEIVDYLTSLPATR